MHPTASRFVRTVRFAVPAVAALTATMALAGPAFADPALVTRSGSSILYTAQPGETNTVTFSNAGGSFQVEDSTSNLIPGPGCVRFNNDPHIVRCGALATVARIQASLGDRNDTATNNTAIASDIVGGEGDDRLFGGSGPDRLLDSDGWNAAPGANTFEGRGGNDTIISRNGGFDRIDCGESIADFDVLLADAASLDAVVPNSCEFVQRS
uniref:Calcium-binding protein n=1 Tax=Streptomyces sp. NBC_00049 TaxID=2903617 RepID=A0AAU2JTX6_9ACTN